MQRAAFAPLVLALFVTACASADHIELTPTDSVLTRRGQVVQMNAKAMDRQGHYFPEVLFDWTTEDTSVATIDERGRVTAEGSGTTYVVACSKNGKLSAKVLVEVVLVESLEVAEPEVELSLSANERYVPRLIPKDGRGRPVTDRQVFLEAAEAGIVQIDGQGGIWPRKLGETVVRATIEGNTGVLLIKVVK